MKKVFTASITKHLAIDQKHIVTIKKSKIFGFTYWTKQLKKEIVNSLTTAKK